MKCSTVVIETENGPVVINESDFDEDQHKLFVESNEPKEGTVSWLKSELESLEVEIPEGAKKAELQELLDAKLAE